MQETAVLWRTNLNLLKGAPHGLMIDTVWRDLAAEKIIAFLDTIDSR